MRIRRDSDRPRRALSAVDLVAVLLAATVATVALVAGARPADASTAERADGPLATIAIGANGAQDVHRTVFRLEDVRPGDRYAFPVVLRNDAGRPAEVTFEGLTFRDGDAAHPGGSDDLRHDAMVTLEQRGVVIGRGSADSATLAGARVYLPAGATQRLHSELAMPPEVGNEARGQGLDVVYHFSVDAGADGGTIDTGVRTDPSVGASGPVAYDQGLPPTGESLVTFHLLVWAFLGAFAALLVGLVLGVLRRRPEPEPVPAPTPDDARRSTR